MLKTTVLNTNYTHVTVVTWKKAIKLILKDKASILENYEGYELITSRGDSVLIPSVIVLKKYVKIPPREKRLSRRNILLRDNYTCAYCHKQFTADDLSIDHIIPKSKGGEESWTNLTTACKRCNALKGDKSLEQFLRERS